MKKILSNKIIWFFIIGIILGAVVWKFILVPRQEATTVNTSSKTKKQTQFTAKKDTIKETLIISGELDAEEKITLRFQSSGLISWIGVKVGDYVKKGQLIATLDQKELQKNLQKYLNTYMDERLDFDQTKDTWRDTPYWGLDEHGRNELDRALQKAQYDLNSSVLDVELKDIALRYANLYAPIDGIVTAVDAPVAGVHVTATQAEFEIINPNSLYFSLLPDQTEVTKLSPGTSGEIIFDSYPDEKITGTIQTISFIPKSGETNTVYEVKIHYPLGDETHTKYRIGMTGDVTFSTNEKRDVLVVPISSVKTEKDKYYVSKKTKEKREKVYVETGIESEDMVEITGGLAEGDIVYD